MPTIEISDETLIRNLSPKGDEGGSKGQFMERYIPKTEVEKTAYWAGMKEGSLDWMEYERGRLDERRKVIGEIKKLITDEISAAHKEGTPTARLTSLYNRFTPPQPKEITNDEG